MPFKTEPCTPPQSPQRAGQAASPMVLDTPEKYYPIIERNGKMVVAFSPDVKKKRDIVYVVKSENGDRYIGLTSRGTQRWQEHLKTAVTKPMTVFHKALGKNPKDFKVGVMATANSPTKLPAIERELIEKRQPTLNSAPGGAGRPSKKRLPEASSSTASPVQLKKGPFDSSDGI